jgi:isocitrate/isopropylmalate dehydrogenase
MNRVYRIAISPGDGVGHEIIGWAQKALETAARLDGGFQLKFIPFAISFGAYQKTGEAISQAAVERVIARGEFLTADLGGKATTDQVGEAVIREL